MTTGKTIALTILLMCCHLIVWAAEIEALISQREKLGQRARKDGTKGELSLESWPSALLTGLPIQCFPPSCSSKIRWAWGPSCWSWDSLPFCLFFAGEAR